MDAASAWELLPPFVDPARCRKCAATTTLRTYAQTRWVHVGRDDDEIEYLEWRCEGCGYGWKTRCADAP